MRKIEYPPRRPETPTPAGEGCPPLPDNDEAALQSRLDQFTTGMTCGYVRSLRSRLSTAEALAGALHADNLPTPPVQTYPPDEFAEKYRQWYHGLRSDALATYRAGQPAGGGE